MIHSNRRTPPGRGAVRNRGRNRSPQPVRRHFLQQRGRRVERTPREQPDGVVAPRDPLDDHVDAARGAADGADDFLVRSQRIRARAVRDVADLSHTRRSRASSTANSCLVSSAALAPFSVVSRYALASSEIPLAALGGPGIPSRSREACPAREHRPAPAPGLDRVADWPCSVPSRPPMASQRPAHIRLPGSQSAVTSSCDDPEGAKCVPPVATAYPYHR